MIPFITTAMCFIGLIVTLVAHFSNKKKDDLPYIIKKTVLYFLLILFTLFGSYDVYVLWKYEKCIEIADYSFAKRLNPKNTLTLYQEACSSLPFLGKKKKKEYINLQLRMTKTRIENAENGIEATKLKAQRESTAKLKTQREARKREEARKEQESAAKLKAQRVEEKKIADAAKQEKAKKRLEEFKRSVEVQKDPLTRRMMQQRVKIATDSLQFAKKDFPGLTLHQATIVCSEYSQVGGIVGGKWRVPDVFEMYAVMHMSLFGFIDPYDYEDKGGYWGCLGPIGASFVVECIDGDLELYVAKAAVKHRVRCVRDI